MKPFVRLAAITFMAIIAGTNLAETIRTLRPAWNGRGDIVSPSEDRFRRARERLPRSGDIGYISEHSPVDAIVDPLSVRDYYLAQYALAPLLVSPEPDRPIVLGNYQTPINAVGTPGIAFEHIGQGLFIIDQRAK